MTPTPFRSFWRAPRCALKGWQGGKPAPDHACGSWPLHHIAPLTAMHLHHRRPWTLRLWASHSQAAHPCLQFVSCLSTALQPPPCPHHARCQLVGSPQSEMAKQSENSPRSSPMSLASRPRSTRRRRRSLLTCRRRPSPQLRGRCHEAATSCLLPCAPPFRHRRVHYRLPLQSDRCPEEYQALPSLALTWQVGLHERTHARTHACTHTCNCQTN